MSEGFKGGIYIPTFDFLKFSTSPQAPGIAVWTHELNHVKTVVTKPFVDKKGRIRGNPYQFDASTFEDAPNGLSDFDKVYFNFYHESEASAYWAGARKSLGNPTHYLRELNYATKAIERNLQIIQQVKDAVRSDPTLQKVRILQDDAAIGRPNTLSLDVKLFPDENVVYNLQLKMPDESVSSQQILEYLDFIEKSNRDQQAKIQKLSDQLSKRLKNGGSLKKK